MTPAYSIIIPTLNEVDHLERTLNAARQSFGESAEYIVVDGGSTDRTVQLAMALGALVLSVSGGRGRQLQEGLMAARGGITLFLHADTLVPADAAEQVERVLKNAVCVGGAFALDFAEGGGHRLLLHLLGRAITLRSRLFRTATGDQTIFARTAVLHAVGGVPGDPLFEDVRLFRRLRQAGRVVILPATVRTSPRLWHRVGPFRMILLHLGFRLLHAIGVSPARLARWYPAYR